MRRLGAVATLLLLAQAPAPPTLVQSAPVQTAPIQSAPLPPASAPAPAAPPPPAWVARGTADLALLDKVSARLTPLSVKVGEAVHAGPLTIAVRGCFVRPPDVAADATAFLDVTDTTPGAPAFHAWVVASAPAVSAMQHPVYDVRLVACK